jgi:p24 family protein gamma-3
MNINLSSFLFNYNNNKNKSIFIIILLIFILKINLIKSVQLTFELPDNERQCFYEDIKKGEESVIEYQVITGGNYDVDMILKNPLKKILYQDQKKQYDSFKFITDESGEYEVCFSNEFSTFTHKLVFMDWQIGSYEQQQQELLGVNSATISGAMTLMETSAQTIHDRMSILQEDQQFYQLKEAQDREHAEELNTRVQIWSIAQLLIITFVGILQVSIIRSFFSKRR